MPYREGLEASVPVSTPDKRLHQGVLLTHGCMMQLSWEEHNLSRLADMESDIRNGVIIGFDIGYVRNEARSQFQPNTEAMRKIDMISGMLGLKKETVGDLMSNEWTCNLMPDGSVNFRKG